jgi:hypothetical protein
MGWLPGQESEQAGAGSLPVQPQETAFGVGRVRTDPKWLRNRQNDGNRSAVKVAPRFGMLRTIASDTNSAGGHRSTWIRQATSPMTRV